MQVMDRLKQDEETDGTGTGGASRRVVFVTGGMGGIGSAICRRLALAGHTIVAGCLLPAGRAGRARLRCLPR